MNYHKNLSLENIDGEVWKQIPIYTFYEASSFGRIKSIQRQVKYGSKPNAKITVKEKILTQTLDKRGYCRVLLSQKGIKPVTCMVHRLVCMAFIPNTENKRTVNHINPIKTLNTLENLEWSTDKENKRHSMEHGLAVICKTSFGREHPNSKVVVQLTQDRILVKEWDCGEDTWNYGFNALCVSRCCRGLQEMHKGFIWEYK